MYKILNLKGVEYKIHENGIIERREDGKVIKQFKRRGYQTVNVGTTTNRCQKYVHRLVAIAFIQLPEGYDFDDLTVNHKDYDKENNSVSNLEWMTREENCRDAYNKSSHGNIGSRNKNAKLKEEKVKEIKKMLNDDIDINTIAQMYNVNNRTILDIKYNNTWKRVKV